MSAEQVPETSKQVQNVQKKFVYKDITIEIFDNITGMKIETEKPFNTKFICLEEFISKNHDIEIINCNTIYNQYIKLIGIEEAKDKKGHFVNGFETFEYRIMFSRQVRTFAYLEKDDNNKYINLFKYINFGSYNVRDNFDTYKFVKVESPFNDEPNGKKSICNSFMNNQIAELMKKVNKKYFAYVHDINNIIEDIKNKRSKLRMIMEAEKVSGIYNSDEFDKEHEEEFNIIDMLVDSIPRLCIFKAWIEGKF